VIKLVGNYPGGHNAIVVISREQDGFKVIIFAVCPRRHEYQVFLQRR
jgi:hypothetical protein